MMRSARIWCLFVVVVVVGLLGLVMISFPLNETETTKPFYRPVNPAHKQLVQNHVLSVLEGQCHHYRTRQRLLLQFPSLNNATQPFLWKDALLPDHLFLYPPPFGFRGVQAKVGDLLKLLEEPDWRPQTAKMSDKCQRCVVIGNGGILRGLELGHLIDRFDIIIRLNSGPLGEFSVDVGNQTSIRMSYPEGTPQHWLDTDPHTQFVAVVYKSSDISWISAMINKHAVPLWDWLFFWQKVPSEIPLERERLRLLNPLVIREASIVLLNYPPPKTHIWRWETNVPTLGVSALNLASLLCDEVSLAGFGYSLSQQDAPLHYYDNQHMSAMQQQKMHSVDRETELLQSLIKEGIISDLTGGVHCSFCSI